MAMHRCVRKPACRSAESGKAISAAIDGSSVLALRPPIGVSAGARTVKASALRHTWGLKRLCTRECRFDAEALVADYTS